MTKMWEHRADEPDTWYVRVHIGTVRFGIGARWLWLHFILETGHAT